MPTRRLGIDLGTANVRLYTRRQGVLLDEPSAIAWVPEEGPGGRVLGVGHRAFEAAQRLPPGGELTRPVAAPEIADLRAATAMVRALVDTTVIGRSVLRPEVALAVPAAVSTRERRMLSEAAVAAGARRSWLVDDVLAAALGAGLDPSREPCAILDLGAGAVQLSVLDPTGTLVQATFPEAGGALDRALVDHAERHLGVRLELRVAEQVKRAVGAAVPLDPPLATEVPVSDLDGTPQTRRRFTSGDVTEALAAPLERLVDGVRAALDAVPEGHRAAVAERGMTLVGGGALLRDLDRHLAERLEMRVQLAADPQTCVVRGSVLALETMQVFHARRLYLA